MLPKAFVRFWVTTAIALDNQSEASFKNNERQLTNRKPRNVTQNRTLEIKTSKIDKELALIS